MPDASPATITSRIIAAVGQARAAATAEAVGDALRAIEPDHLAEFFHHSLDAADGVIPIGQGLAASPGAASGRIVLSAEEAVAAADAGHEVILVRPETSPDDVLGMQASKGILTSRGGLVSHAAVVARGWGIPAVVGAADVAIDGDRVLIGGPLDSPANDPAAEPTVLRAGDEITIDGSTGNIYAGSLAVSGVEPPAELATLLGWADAVAAGHVEVRANADTEGDAAYGRELGARGIGLCRTEHMFLSHDRLPIVRRFILADDPDAEAAALAELEEVQTHDFERLLQAMDGLPVTVRLLDPPLHEFLPDLLDLTAREAAGQLTGEERTELVAVRRLHESNPMIGTRGVRLGIVRGGLYEMQVRALCRAAATLIERDLNPHVEVMIPLVVDAEELRIARSWVTQTLTDVGHPEFGADVIAVGAMVETPRAALTAGALARHADFFSFGTNDLTQMTYAFSRDDVEARLLPAYQARGILAANPFAVLDQEGVGQLVRMGCESGRAAKPDLKLGVCGEHAGHPGSADFLVRLGVDSVSCSPFRVPMARLGVAQALLASGRVDLASVAFDSDPDSDSSAPAGPGEAAEQTAGPGEAAEQTAGPGEAAEQTAGPGEAAEQTAGGSEVTIEIDETLVLHVLRIRGFVTPDGFTESIGRHPADLLEALVETGLVRHMEARDMFGLLPPGRQRHEAQLAQWADDATKAGLAGPYHRFLALNDRFKELCTRWQVRDGEPNDHGDLDYDRGCVAELNELSATTAPVVADLARVVPRLARYLQRLQVASQRVSEGDTTRFTGVMCESFHDIWMELHEDLIVIQGIDRSAEGSF